MKSNIRIHRGLAGLCGFTFCVLTAGQAMAQRAWTVLGADANWGTAANWSTNNVPWGDLLTVTFSGSTQKTSSNKFFGLISTGNSSFNVTNNGAGILTLSGDSTYTGATLLQAGTIFLSSIADGGSGSNIGTGTSMRMGNFGVTATLTDTGSGSTTARTVQKFNSGSYYSTDLDESYESLYQNLLHRDPEYAEVLGRLKSLLPTRAASSA